MGMVVTRGRRLKTCRLALQGNSVISDTSAGRLGATLGGTNAGIEVAAPPSVASTGGPTQFLVSRIQAARSTVWCDLIIGK